MGNMPYTGAILRCLQENNMMIAAEDIRLSTTNLQVLNCKSFKLYCTNWSLGLMNQWTVPLEWNGGMGYWNDL